MAIDNESNPVGFVLNYKSFSSVSLGQILVLNDLYVDSKYRKNGIGEMLIRRTFDFAKKIEAVRVDLGTAKNNFQAQKLYEKLGFKKDVEYYSYSYTMRHNS